MRSFSFLHTGDCHLGYRQYGFNVREDDFEAAVSRIVKLALELKVDAVLWAGDIFDSPSPSARSVFFMYQAVQQLGSAGVVSIGIDGNHDAADGCWLRVCGMRVFTSYPVLTQHNFDIAGLNYRRPKETIADLERLIAEDRKRKIDVLLLHQPLGDMVAFGSEITAEWLAMKLKPLGVRYVALGDIHDFLIREIDGITFLYPGSVEMTDIDEQPDKKCVRVMMPNEGRPEIDYYDIPTRKVVRYDVKTDEDFAKMMADVQARQNFVLPVVTVDTTLAGGVERVQNALGGGIPHRLMRAADEASLKQKFSDPEWDRKGSVIDLKTAVAESFPEQTEEHQLTMQLLSDWKNASKLAKDYLNQKGVTL
jgi:DNA repair exonuclease SbcCD nuclease subunit